MITDAEGRLWKAVLSRDGREAGNFVYAVRTTGIYCRPGCSSRTPKRVNIEYYFGTEDAEAAGYRACKRCRPGDYRNRIDARSDLVEAACRRILSTDEAPSLAVLAEEAGLSPSHFHKLFRESTGITPKEFASSVQANRFLDAINRGLSVTRAVYESGYSSPARAYDGLKKQTALTPTEMKKGGEGLTLRFAVAKCYFGAVLVGITEKGICAVLLGDEETALREALQRLFPSAVIKATTTDETDLIRRAVAEIREPTGSHNLPLDIAGTAFQRRVWKALQKIPSGSTTTYGEIARRIGKPTASRAVAQACAANKIALFIPCHRIIRSGGGLGGYRWGVERKRQLLQREKDDEFPVDV